ncbi:MAG: electron transporter RnfE [Arcobacter sp.]|nr:MAG: electron transporter RnfE [Arcobacter sp.]
MWECMNTNMSFSHGFGMIIFWILVITLIYFIFTRIRNKPEVDTALDLLKKRLAKGEINKEEFENLKEVIQ